MFDVDPATDPAVAELANSISPERKALWVADEHPVSSQLLKRLANCNCALLRNRFEQVEAAKEQSVNAHFSDFEPEQFQGGFQQILFRISKEKPIVHAVINRAFQALPEGGELLIAGYKQEGIKSYIDKAAKLFDYKPETERGKSQLSIARLRKVGTSISPDWLDDSDYSTIRTIGELEGIPVLSKPGQYGWKKFDVGSQILADELAERFGSGFPGSVLDLGCGYGYLALKAALLGADRIVATDNCAAALACCERNLQTSGVKDFQIVASNAAREISEQFDTIICNPPFHQGFKSNSELTQRFLQPIHRNLKRDGEAWFVVNQFIPLPRLAEENDLVCEQTTQRDGFRVFCLSVN